MPGMNASTSARMPHTVAITLATLARSLTNWTQCEAMKPPTSSASCSSQCTKPRRVLQPVVVDRFADHLGGGVLGVGAHPLRPGDLLGGGVQLADRVVVCVLQAHDLRRARARRSIPRACRAPLSSRCARVPGSGQADGTCPLLPMHHIRELVHQPSHARVSAKLWPARQALGSLWSRAVPLSYVPH